MIRESRAIAHEGEALDLDPFAFWPDRSSRLVGLGGPEAGEDPDYAFHTLYAACGAGPILFTIGFRGLRAERGTLILRVHELPEVMGAHARQAAIAQVQLLDLIRGTGRVAIPALARAGSLYALVGHIYGDTAASTDEVAIEVARRTPDPHDPAMPTRFRADGRRVGTVPQIVGGREGALATPVSQPCTVAQLREPVLEGVLAQMGGLAGRDALTRWEHAYLARVLDRYDAARPGARGLGIGALGDPLGHWIAAQGCAVTLSHAGQPPAADLPPHADVLPLDPAAIDGPAGYDFAWATRAGGLGPADRQRTLRFIEDALRTLKPGGLLALVLPFDPGAGDGGDQPGSVIRRPDVNRIVLLLLSRGHQVAQICPWGTPVTIGDATGEPRLCAFGLVVRRVL